MFDIRDRSYWVIEGFRFSHQAIPQASHWWTYGITATGPAKGLAVRNNVFDGNSRHRAGGTVIRLMIDMQDSIIENNRFQNWPSGADLMGVTLETDWRNFEARAIPNKNTVIRGNTFEGLGGDGVQIAPWGGQNTLIEKNVFRAGNTPAENAIDVKCSFFTTIRGNVMSGFRPKNSNPRGDAVIVHLMAQDVTIEDNLLYDNGVGITVASGNPDLAMPTPSWYSGSKSVQRVAIYRNIIIDSNRKSSTDGRIGPGRAIDVSGVSGLKIFHNTIAFAATAGIRMERALQTHIANNIFYRTALSILDESSGSTNFSALTIGANLFDDESAAGLVHRTAHGLITKQSLQAFQAATRQAAGSITGNPAFAAPATAAASADFGLRPNSPAIDAAGRLPGYNDRFAGSAPDFGAIEYTVR